MIKFSICEASTSQMLQSNESLEDITLCMVVSLHMLAQKDILFNSLLDPLILYFNMISFEFHGRKNPLLLCFKLFILYGHMAPAITNNPVGCKVRSFPLPSLAAT